MLASCVFIAAISACRSACVCAPVSLFVVAAVPWIPIQLPSPSTLRPPDTSLAQPLGGRTIVLFVSVTILSPAGGKRVNSCSELL